MNIYVVSNGEYEEASIIGAAVDRTGAERIADRWDLKDSRVSGWAPWKEQVSPSEGCCTWSRNAINADGTVRISLYQEIVVVPLDGMPDTNPALSHRSPVGAAQVQPPG